MGVVIYAPALALESVTGIDKKWAILIISSTVILSHVGGMKAVL
jgi:Na+/proline symporter